MTQKLNMLKTSGEIMHRRHSMFSSKTPHLPLWEQTCSGFWCHFHPIFAISTISKLYPSTVYLASHKGKLCFKLHSQRTETCCLRSITHFQQIRQSRVIRATCMLLLPGPVYTLQEVFELANSIQKTLKRTLGVLKFSWVSTWVFKLFPRK